MCQRRHRQEHPRNVSQEWHPEVRPPEDLQQDYERLSRRQKNHLPQGTLPIPPRKDVGDSEQHEQLQQPGMDSFEGGAGRYVELRGVRQEQEQDVGEERVEGVQGYGRHHQGTEEVRQETAEVL